MDGKLQRGKDSYHTGQVTDGERSVKRAFGSSGCYVEDVPRYEVSPVAEQVKH